MLRDCLGGVLLVVMVALAVVLVAAVVAKALVVGRVGGP